MKTFRNFLPNLLCFAALLQGMAFSHPLAQANKIALIVAVGDYPAESGWPKINSVNDADLIRSALLQQGFPSERIHTLFDADATRAGILQAVRTQLLEPARPGDVVYFHFSGHGQQVADNNGKADEPDGFDEAIVPYDSPLNYVAGEYEGQNLLRDDDLGKLFDEIRRKIGPGGQLIVVLDACHSGTGTRGMGAARGTDRKMADSLWIAGNAGRGFSQEDKQLGIDPGGRKAPMVAFFGAAQNQLNFETQDQQGRRVGSLSFAFSKHFLSAGENSTYRGLFEQIRKEMAVIAPRQTPQIEGDLDRTVLGGETVAQMPFFRVKEILPDSSIRLDGGWLQGLNPGTVLGFYPPDTRDPKSKLPLFTGVVTTSQPLESTVSPEGAADAAKLRDAWVYVLEESPGDLRINLALLLPESPLKSALSARFAAQTLIRLEEPYELALVQGGSMLELLTIDDYSLGRFPLNLGQKILVDSILQAVKLAGQAKFLRSLSTASTQLNVTMEILPITTDGKGNQTGSFDLASLTDANGTLRMPENTLFKIRVKNNGSHPAFFTLVDIQPNNDFNILIPAEDDPNQTPEQFYIQAGGSWETPDGFRVFPPYGREIFKLLATTDKIDLRGIKLRRGHSSRGPGSKPLEKMFADTFFTEDVQTRGGRVERLAAGSLGVFTTTFLITAPK